MTLEVSILRFENAVKKRSKTVLLLLLQLEENNEQRTWFCPCSAAVQPLR